MAMTIMNDASAAMTLGELNKNISELGKRLKNVSSGQRIDHPRRGYGEGDDRLHKGERACPSRPVHVGTGESGQFRHLEPAAIATKTNSTKPRVLRGFLLRI